VKPADAFTHPARAFCHHSLTLDPLGLPIRLSAFACSAMALASTMAERISVRSAIQSRQGSPSIEVTAFTSTPNLSRRYAIAGASASFGICDRWGVSEPCSGPRSKLCQDSPHGRPEPVA
jgi:hypothetical protein